MTRLMTRLGALLVAGAAASVALGGCGGQAITAARVDDALGPAFSHLYARQQTLLGNGTAAAQASADCHRTSGPAATTGPGNDWICQVLLQLGNQPSSAYTYDVTVQANGCYTAEGPPALVGGHTLTTKSGSHRVNPLFAIDGCFET